MGVRERVGVARGVLAHKGAGLGQEVSNLGRAGKTPAPSHAISF